MMKHCIFAKMVLIKGYVQGALRKELCIAPVVECFKTTNLRNSNW